MKMIEKASDWRKVIQSNTDVLYSIKFYMNTCSVTYETARKDLLLLDRKGLVEKFKKAGLFIIFLLKI